MPANRFLLFNSVRYRVKNLLKCYMHILPGEGLLRVMHEQNNDYLKQK